MDTAEARDLLKGRWLSLEQDEFDIAIQQLIHEHGGDDWIRDRQHLLTNPAENSSAWDGIVRFPEESLMPFREANFGDKTIFLNEEDISDLMKQ